MPKRSSQERIEQYYAKIKKLQHRKESRRRVIVYSSSDSEENLENGTKCGESHSDVCPLPEAPSPPPTESPAPPLSPPALQSPYEPVNEVIPTQEVNRETTPELAPELLNALGDEISDAPVYGPDIHHKLAQRWLPILKKGLQPETKEKLLKEHTVPENCKLMKAPLLNPEIAAAVADFIKTRDQKMKIKQDQLGLGIAAVNKAMTLLLTGDNKVQALKDLSDACRILTDLHFIETQVRAKLLTAGLDKSFLTIIQGQERDETLFGDSLGEKIKASKAIEKQGLLIKKPPLPKPSTSCASATPAATRPRYQGNWSGPPRYQQPARGGRSSAYRNQGQRAPAPPPASNRRTTSTAAANRRVPPHH